MKRETKSKKRRQYDAEFKSDLLRMHEDGRSISSLAESFGINETVIYRWKRAVKVTSKPVDSSTAEENKRLRGELAEMRQERDILKKALAIFSRL